MAKLNCTSEQLAIFDEAETSTENLLIEALAGSAKTTSLVQLTRHLTGSTLAIAFNKKISDEMKEKMPSGVECRTLNSLGHRVWQSKLGKKLQLSDSKMHSILTTYLDSLPFGEERDHLFENLADIRIALQGAKNHGHVPDSIATKLGDKCQPILTNEQLFDMLPEEYSPAAIACIISVLTTSYEQALEGRIDYADQLLMPVTIRCLFPYFANVLVDEAQDLSELNHRMLEKIKKKRLIAVGDSLQAIYAFRGAHRDSMQLLASRFDMKVMHLSTSFRCPEAICLHVKNHAHRIQFWEGNPNNPGLIRNLQAWSVDEIPDGAAVICRNNAPLFRLAIKLLQHGRRPQVWGRDIAANLLKIMEGLGAPNMKQEDAVAALARYQTGKEAKLRKDSAKQALYEKVSCIRVFLEDAETLHGAITIAKTVFNSAGSIDLCTGHKSKGHEWDNVFFLDHQLLGDDPQDLNLRYVIATRSKRNLTYINLEGAL